METFETRTKLFFQDDYDKIKQASVLVVGIGGVGSFVVEALARTGVGTIHLTDYDTIDPSNLNRQIQTTIHNIGDSKCIVMQERIHAINPDCHVILHEEMDLKETLEVLPDVDFMIDAIDTMTYKLELIEAAQIAAVPFISAMGAANKLNLSELKVATLNQTKYDPFAKILRYEAKRKGLELNFPVVYSEEQPIKQQQQLSDSEVRKKQMPPASVIFVPATMGLLLAEYAIKTIIKK